MRPKTGWCALALVFALTGVASAYEDIEGWDPIKIDMTRAQFEAIPGFGWSVVKRFDSSPGHPWVIYEARRPQSFGGQTYVLSVSLLDDRVIQIDLRRRLDLPDAACRRDYERLLGILEKRYSPPEDADHFTVGTVLDVPADADQIVVRHAGLKSVSSLYREGGVPKILATRFGVDERLTADMRFRALGEELRCTDVFINIR